VHGRGGGQIARPIPLASGAKALYAVGVDDDTLRARLEFLEEMVRELYRRGVITDDMVAAVAERFGSRADRANFGDAAVADHCAHMAVMLPIEASTPTQSEWEAERRRARLRVVED
jgi:DUF1680 family protein